MTIDNRKFEIALANSGLTIGQAAERAGINGGVLASIWIYHINGSPSLLC